MLKNKDTVLSHLKTRSHRRFLSQQLNVIFVAPKLQLQNGTCKPAAISARFQCKLSPQYRKSFERARNLMRRFLTKLNHKGPFGRFCHAGFQFVFVWLWLIQTKKTCIRLCLRLRRALGTVLTLHKQVAATAKSSSIFMRILRVHFPSC